MKNVVKRVSWGAFAVAHGNQEFTISAQVPIKQRLYQLRFPTQKFLRIPGAVAGRDVIPRNKSDSQKGDKWTYCERRGASRRFDAKAPAEPAHQPARRLSREPGIHSGCFRRRSLETQKDRDHRARDRREKLCVLCASVFDLLPHNIFHWVYCRPLAVSSPPRTSRFPAARACKPLGRGSRWQPAPRPAQEIRCRG